MIRMSLISSFIDVILNLSDENDVKFTRGIFIGIL